VNQSGNGQSLSHGNRPRDRGTYTGERLKQLRPEIYREVVRLLAEPREHVSYRKICRRCRVTDDTVKAIEQREAVPIAARKQELLSKALRIADKAAARIEDKIDTANISQAGVIFGITTDKMLLLAGDHTQNVHVTVEPGPNLYAQFQALHDRLQQQLPPPKPKTIQANVLPESQAGSGEHSANGFAEP
jgi:hypothetical protein